MSEAIENLQAAQKRAMAIRPKAGGFPLPGRDATARGSHKKCLVTPGVPEPVPDQRCAGRHTGAPLVSGTTDIPPFNCESLIKALRTDQAGESTFPEFLAASWRAGVIRYDVNFAARTVTYYGCNGEEYTEAYPAVDLG